MWLREHHAVCKIYFLSKLNLVVCILPVELQNQQILRELVIEATVAERPAEPDRPTGNYYE